MVVLRGAIGLVGVGILVLALRPVALFIGDERWLQVDVTFGSSYSVNDGLHGVAGHWAYPTLLVVTVPPGVSDAVVRGQLAVSREVLPAVLRENRGERELLFYTSNPSEAAERARALGFRFSLRQDAAWSEFSRYDPIR